MTITRGTKNAEIDGRPGGPSQAEPLTVSSLRASVPDATVTPGPDLTAIAPDMLEALQDCVAASDANCGDSLMNAILSARSVIAKAVQS